MIFMRTLLAHGIFYVRLSCKAKPFKRFILREKSVPWPRGGMALLPVLEKENIFKSSGKPIEVF